MDNYDFKIDPKLVDELMNVRAENAYLYRQVDFLKNQHEFLKKVIETLISSRNA